MKTLSRASPYVIAVDNEKDLLVLFKASMQPYGYHVETTLNGKDLWRMLRKRKPDIIFLDIHMDGVDGGSICHKLKQDKSTADIPVIMLSGNDNIEAITTEFCADGFLKKPFCSQKIVELITRVLAKAISRFNVLFPLLMAGLCP
jgi:CheY-like chemotaxis protein